jgi:hypothetical protein
VENELDRLEAKGIQFKVDWSPWATQVVPVTKKNGAVRLCCDFNITVNPVLQAEQCPLLRIEDIFATPSGGKHFSKVGLAEACLQMEIKEDSNVFYDY